MVRRQVDRVRPLDQDLGSGCVLRNVNRNIFFCGDALAAQVLRWNNIIKTFSHQNFCIAVTYGLILSHVFCVKF